MRLNHLLEKVYYEPERPSALGDVNKFYRAARRYGVQRSQVLHTTELYSTQTCKKTLSPPQSTCK